MNINLLKVRLKEKSDIHLPDSLISVFIIYIEMFVIQN